MQDCRHLGGVEPQMIGGLQQAADLTNLVWLRQNQAAAVERPTQQCVTNSNWMAEVAYCNRCGSAGYTLTAGCNLPVVQGWSATFSYAVQNLHLVMDKTAF